MRITIMHMSLGVIQLILVGFVLQCGFTLPFTINVTLSCLRSSILFMLCTYVYDVCSILPNSHWNVVRVYIGMQLLIFFLTHNVLTIMY